MSKAFFKWAMFLALAVSASSIGFAQVPCERPLELSVPAVVPPSTVTPLPAPLQEKGEAKAVETRLTSFAYEKELRIVEAAYIEVVLKCGTELAVLKRCVIRSAELADKAGCPTLAVELKEKAKAVLAPPLCGEDLSAAQARYFRAKAAETRAKIADAMEDERPRYLALAKMLDRAAIFWLKVGHSRGDACLLNELYCRIVRARRVCWNECEIQAAYRIGISTCAQHGELMAEWMPVMSEPHSAWSVCKASQLGGKNDLDAEACTLWLQEIKPYLATVYSETELDKLYASPELRTGLWLIARRGLTCAKEDYYGKADKLDETAYKAAVEKVSKLVTENRKALECRYGRLLPECHRLLPIGWRLVPIEPVFVVTPCCGRSRP